MMISRDIDFIRDTLHKRFTEWSPPPTFELWPDDIWLASSAMQKAIRRGDIYTAQQAAANAYRLDKRAVNRRLVVTAFEDISIGDIEACAIVTLICTDLSLRRKYGELKAYLFAVDTLARSVKCRAADHIYVIVNDDPDLAPMRDSLYGSSLKELSTTLRHSDNLFEKAFALQLLKQRSVDEAGYALEQTSLSPKLIDIALTAAKRSGDPLSLYLPLMAKSFIDTNNTVSINDPIALKCNHIPLYAADPLHTRLGKFSLQQWRNSIDELRGYNLKTLGLAVFHSESSVCDKELENGELIALKCNDIRIDLTKSGLPEDQHHVLFDKVKRHMDALNEVRKVRLEKINFSENLRLL